MRLRLRSSNHSCVTGAPYACHKCLSTNASKSWLTSAAASKVAAMLLLGLRSNTLDESEEFGGLVKNLLVERGVWTERGVRARALIERCCAPTRNQPSANASLNAAPTMKGFFDRSLNGACALAHGSFYEGFSPMSKKPCAILSGARAPVNQSAGGQGGSGFRAGKVSG